MVELCAKNLQIMRNDFTDYARIFCQLCANYAHFLPIMRKLCAPFANYVQIMRAHNRIIQRFPGMGSSRTVLDLEDSSRTKMCGLGLGLGLEPPGLGLGLGLGLEPPGLGLGLED